MTQLISRAALIFLGLLLMPACAEIRMGEPKTVQSKVLRREQRVVVSSSDFEAGFEHSEHVIHVSAYSTCDLSETQLVRNTVRREKKNDLLAPEAVLLGFGLIPTGIGIGILADSSNVYPNDRNSRLYNSSGTGGAAAGGIILLAWGAAMMVVPMVDMVRTIGSEETETEATEPGAVIQPRVPCRDAPPPKPGLSISGRTPRNSFFIGNTDSQGMLRANLAQVMPASVFASEPQLNTVDIYANNKRLGSVNVSGLAPVVMQSIPNDNDEQLWGISNRNGCEAKQDCSGVKKYLQLLPNGRHAGEARALLEALNQGSSLQVAAPAMTPEEKAKCEKDCQKGCKKADKACVSACAAEKCQ